MHPLHRWRRDLLDKTILLGEYRGGFAERLGIDTGLEFRIQHYSGSASQMCDLITAGLGLALIPARLAVPAPIHRPQGRAG